MNNSPAAAAVAALGAALEQAQQAVANELWRSVDSELADLKRSTATRGSCNRSC